MKLQHQELSATHTSKAITAKQCQEAIRMLAMAGEAGLQVGELVRFTGADPAQLKVMLAGLLERRVVARRRYPGLYNDRYYWLGYETKLTCKPNDW